MKFNFTKSMAIASLCIAIAFTSFNPALADTLKSNPSENLQQAATEVVKDTGVKEQFGQSKNGDRLLDKAQQKANKKLKNLAEKTETETDLPASKKLFIDNLSDQR